MADKKITELTNITGANLVDADEFVVVDISADETKAITLGELKEAFDSGSGFVRITGDTMTGALDVQSTITADGLTVENTSGATLNVNTGLAGADSKILLHEGSTASPANGASIRYAGSTNEFSIGVGSSVDTKRLSIARDTGDISFYEDTGTTAKFFWDASAESLGIGTSSPLMPIHISGTGDGGIQITKEGSVASRIKTVAGALAIGVDGANGDTERMRIDSSGNLLVGQTSASGFGSTTGIQMLSDGRILSTVSGDQALALSRTSSDGNIAEFYKDGTTVGSIGTDGSRIYIGTGDTGLYFWTSNNAVLPWNTTTNIERDNAIDLGNSIGRFKDLYLSAKTKYQASGGNQHSIGADTNDLVIRSETAGSETARFTYGGNVGIGTSSPTATLDVRRVDADGAIAEFHQSAGYGFTLSSSQTVASIESGYLQDFVFKTGSTATERMRIDSSGNLLVGMTSASTNNDGAGIRADGLIHAKRADVVATFNRKTTDGTVVQIAKDNTVVGSIGVKDGDLTIGTGDTGLYFSDGVDSVYPYNTSTLADRDAAVDIGYPSVRFKDLYLSGGVFLGGAGASNKLDDYEEGTWTPSFRSGFSGAPTFNTRGARYTKIGRMVYCDFYIQVTGTGSSGHIQVDGLPFTSTLNALSRGGGLSTYVDMITGGTFQFYGGPNINYFSCYIDGNAAASFAGSISSKYLIGIYTYETDA